MTREGFIKKWLGNKNFQYCEEHKELMREDLDSVIDYHQQQVKSVDLADVVNWLPFIPQFSDQYHEFAKEGKLIKLYDDGTQIRQGEDEPNAVVTHFRRG